MCDSPASLAIIYYFLFHRGVPVVVDLASMRNAVAQLGGNPHKINPIYPVDLVIDHSVVVDAARTLDNLLILHYLIPLSNHHA